MSGWSVLFWIIVTLVVLYPLNRWISIHVQGVAFILTGSPQVAMWVFWVIFLPGTLLHELSHWLTATLLGVRTIEFSLWPEVKKGGELQMGAVQVDVPDPFRHSLIGLAPLLAGSIAVLLIGQSWLNLGEIGRGLVAGDLQMTGRAIENTLNLPDVWLWLYFIFAISNAMLPSASDREAWRTVLIYLGVALILVIGLGANPNLSPEIQTLVLTGLSYLLSAFAITIAVNILFLWAILSIETVLSWLLNRQIRYNRYR